MDSNYKRKIFPMKVRIFTLKEHACSLKKYLT